MKQRVEIGDRQPGQSGSGFGTTIMDNEIGQREISVPGVLENSAEPARTETLVIDVHRAQHRGSLGISGYCARLVENSA